MAGSFLPPAIFEIKAIADQAISKFNDVNKELGQMEDKAQAAGGQVDKIGKASRIATAGLLAAGAAFAGFAAVGIKEAIETEDAFNKLSATLAATGNNSAKNRARIKELTGSYADLGFEGDKAAVAFERLLRINGDVDKSQQLLALSADYARAKGVSLESAAQILGRASMGSARAFKEFGIELDATLPKSEAIEKAMGQLNDKIGSQAENATKTLSVQMDILKERFNDAAESVGAVLLPIIKDLLEKLNQAIEFVKRNANVFQILGGIILTVAVALASYNAAIKVQMALTKAWTVITTLQTMATNLLKGQQLALNTAMKLNPIGLVVAATMLLIGALAILWNKSESFRKLVIQVGKAGLTAFASYIPILGKVWEFLAKVATGPLRALLSALSHLPGVGKYAKAGLDILNKGLDNVSTFADTAATKAKQLADNLDKLNKPIKIGGTGGLDIPELSNTKVVKNVAGMDPAAKAALQKANDEAKKLIADTQDKILEAHTKYAEKRLEIEKDYNKKVTKLREDAAKAIADAEKDAVKKRTKLTEDSAAKIAQLEIDASEKRASLIKDAADRIIELEQDAADKRAEATKNAAEKIRDLEMDAQKKIADIQNKGKNERLSATEKFNNQVAELAKKKNDALAKLEQDNQTKLAQISEDGANKLQSIVTESMNRLRSAFGEGTALSLKDTFKELVEAGKTSADDLAKVMRERLAGVKKLAENASALAGAGFSQTFIEQVVSQGPEVGNQLAQTILDATPETRAELVSLYGEIEKASETGLDALATQMNSGAELATSALTKAYAQAQKDTAEALQKQGQDYLEAQAQINKEFNTALADAEKTRDSAIAESISEQAAAIAEVQKELAIAIAETQQALTESLAKIDANLAKSTADVNKKLVDALAANEKDLKDKTEAIQKDLANALAEVDKDLQETIAGINEDLNTALAEANNELAEAMEAARKDFSDSLIAIEKDFKEKMGSLEVITAATAKKLKELAQQLANARAAAGEPITVTTPVAGVGTTTTSLTTGAVVTTPPTSGVAPSAAMSGYGTTNVSITGVNLSDPQETRDAVVTAIKYGQVVQVATTANTVRTGLSAVRSGTIRSAE